MIATLVADPLGTVVFASQELCTLLGCPLHKLVGGTLGELLSPEDDGLAQYLDNHSVGKVHLRQTKSFTAASGKPLSLTFKVYPVYDQDGMLKVHVATSDRQERLPHIKPIHIDALRKVYPHTSLSYEEGQQLFDRATNYLRATHLFRDAELDLKSLSAALKTNQLYLSQAVNFFAGVSFRDYLNQCRIDWLLQDCTTCHALPVHELWNHAGFGSYSAFRRYVINKLQLSPSQFSRKLKAGRHAAPVLV